VRYAFIESHRTEFSVRSMCRVLMGWPLEMPSAVALTIAYGIADDAIIHALGRLKFDVLIEKG